MNAFITCRKLFFQLTILVVSLGGCVKENPSRHLNLGDWYLKKGLVDEAIMEYREVSRLYGGEQSKLNRDEFQTLGTAHMKLAIAYTKKGWWEYALSEAKRSFDISPNKDCHELISLIQDKLKQGSSL